jgi:hypothetical protein
MSLPLPLSPAFVLLPDVEEPRADGAGLGVELGLGFRDTRLLLLDPDNKQIQQCNATSGHFICKYTTIYLYEVLIFFASYEINKKKITWRQWWCA